MPKDIKKLALFIVGKVNDIPDLTGKNPNSLAASAIFLACEQIGNLRTAEDIGRICGAAENTIKQTIKLMMPNLAKLFPPDVTPSHLIASRIK